MPSELTAGSTKSADGPTCASATTCRSRGRSRPGCGRILLVRPRPSGQGRGPVVSALRARGVEAAGERRLERCARPRRGGDGTRAPRAGPAGLRTLRHAQPGGATAAEAEDGDGRPGTLQSASAAESWSRPEHLDRRPVAGPRLLARGRARERAPPALARGVSLYRPAAEAVRGLARRAVVRRAGCDPRRDPAGSALGGLRRLENAGPACRALRAGRPGRPGRWLARRALQQAVPSERPAGRAVLLHARTDARPLRRRAALERARARRALRPVCVGQADRRRSRSDRGSGLRSARAQPKAAACGREPTPRLLAEDRGCTDEQTPPRRRRRDRRDRPVEPRRSRRGDRLPAERTRPGLVSGAP